MRMPPCIIHFWKAREKCYSVMHDTSLSDHVVGYGSVRSPLSIYLPKSSLALGKRERSDPLQKPQKYHHSIALEERRKRMWHMWGVPCRPEVESGLQRTHSPEEVCKSLFSLSLSYISPCISQTESDKRVNEACIVIYASGATR